MIVGADAHIGSRGSIEFAEDYRKPGTSCGWTESSTPTKYGESKTGGVGADDSVGPENIADSLQVSVKSEHSAGPMCTGKRQTHIRNAPSSRTAVTGIGPYRVRRKFAERT